MPEFSPLMLVLLFAALCFVLYMALTVITALQRTRREQERLEEESLRRLRQEHFRSQRSEPPFYPVRDYPRTPAQTTPRSYPSTSVPPGTPAFRAATYPRPTSPATPRTTADRAVRRRRHEEYESDAPDVVVGSLEEIAGLVADDQQNLAALKRQLAAEQYDDEQMPATHREAALEEARERAREASAQVTAELREAAAEKTPSYFYVPGPPPAPEPARVEHAEVTHHAWTPTPSHSESYSSSTSHDSGSSGYSSDSGSSSSGDSGGGGGDGGGGGSGE